MTCPITQTELLAAIAGGAFRSLTDQDRLAFVDADDDARIWFPSKKGPDGEELCVLIDAAGETLIIEVYAQRASGKNAVWQGALDFRKVH
jgi:hypothetical protein